MCGEKCACRCDAEPFPGSPPHVRGKELHHLINDIGHGITPAYAGKRESRSASGSACRDHPRMCGEKVSSTSPMKCLKGSPPACAGRSKTFLGPADSCEDHPRMCGEKLAVENKVNEPQGSPPHVRGKDPILHLRQCLQVRPDHARHLVHLSLLRA